uniref:Uncharacterized protein n=1 Tax=Ciona savignyi TaxID=51511 RepID=H2YV82_CIOSA
MKKNKTNHICSFTFRLIFDNDLVSCDHGDMERTIYSAMLNLYGMVGVGHDPELKYFDSESGNGTIAVNSMFLSKVWAALTLVSDVCGKKCCISVLNIST